MLMSNHLLIYVFQKNIVKIFQVPYLEHEVSSFARVENERTKLMNKLLFFTREKFDNYNQHIISFCFIFIYWYDGHGWKQQLYSSRQQRSNELITKPKVLDQLQSKKHLNICIN